MDIPKISVIVPAYNAAPWLSKCLDSILNQTYYNLEVVVINDGSTDETPEIIDGYAMKDSRVKAFHQENKGLVLTRERGIQVSTGSFIGFVDADDYIAKDMYERLVNNAIKHNADISHCGVGFCFEDGKIESHYGTGKIIIQNNFEGVRDLLQGEFIEPGLWNKLYKAEILKDSCLDTTVLNNEDLLRNFIAFSRSRLSVYEDFCGYMYMQRQGSMSKNSTKLVETERHIFKARKLIVENCTPEIFPYAMRTWISCVVNSVNSLVFIDDPKAKMYCKKCRKFLLKHKNDIRYLIKRQRFAAILIMISLKLHRFVYQIYRR